MHLVVLLLSVGHHWRRQKQRRRLQAWACGSLEAQVACRHSALRAVRSGCTARNTAACSECTCSAAAQPARTAPRQWPRPPDEHSRPQSPPRVQQPPRPALLQQPLGQWQVRLARCVCVEHGAASGDRAQSGHTDRGFEGRGEGLVAGETHRARLARSASTSACHFAVSAARSRATRLATLLRSSTRRCRAALVACASAADRCAALRASSDTANARLTRCRLLLCESEAVRVRVKTEEQRALRAWRALWPLCCSAHAQHDRTRPPAQYPQR